MVHASEEERQAIREAIRKICAAFPDAYWRDVDKAGAYPQAFVDALTASGYLATLIPEEYGGAGPRLTQAGGIPPGGKPPPPQGGFSPPPRSTPGPLFSAG